MAASTSTSSVAEPSASWTPIGEYENKIYTWSKEFLLGVPGKDILRMVNEMPDHAGSSQPSVFTWRTGKGIKMDWAIIMAILREEMYKIDTPFTPYFGAPRVSYHPGSEPANDTQPRLESALLDIGTYRCKEGMPLRKIRRECARWPSLEVAWLIALNPHLATLMEDGTMPSLWSAGITVNTNGAPNRAPNFVSREHAGLLVVDTWDNQQGCEGVVASFCE